MIELHPPPKKDIANFVIMPQMEYYSEEKLNSFQHRRTQEKKGTILSRRSTDFILRGQSGDTLNKLDRNLKHDLFSKLLARLMFTGKEQKILTLRHC